MKTLGKKIRLLRHQKGWSQEDVAIRLGISIPAFSKIETGVTDINLSRLEQIANIYEVNVVNLLSLEAEEPEPQHSSLNIAQKKKVFWIYYLTAAPFFTFIRMFISRRGFLDGWHGFVVCGLSAFHDFAKYAKLWEKEVLQHHE